LLVGSTDELTNLMCMALAEDSRFEVSGSVKDPGELIATVQRVRPDAVVFHEQEGASQAWSGVIAAVRNNIDGVELVELGLEVWPELVTPGTPERRQLALAEMALSIGNTIALLLSAQRGEIGSTA